MSPAMETPAYERPFCSGTAAIVGRGNVGKSTLLNALLRERLAIVTPTPQTTRDRILGVLRHGRAQIALVDTPGLHRPKSRLGRRMNATARDAARGADVIVYVTSIPKKPQGELVPLKGDIELLEQLDPGERAILVINKIDLIAKTRELLLPLLDAFSKVRQFSSIVPISALRENGTVLVLDEIAKLLPARGPAYDEDFLTDRPMRFFASEYVREQVILATKQEIPHSVAVIIDKYEESEKITHIDAIVQCAKDSQRKIIIGKGGERLKGIGIGARKRIETLIGCQVHLNLWVTTQEGWFDSSKALDSLGYVIESAELDEATL